MADNKKYYYLKLKEGFFESDEMKILQSMPDGYLYSDILLKLYLRSLRNGGRLMYKDVIPYTSSVLATLTGHQVGTVEKAVETLKRLGLIEVLDNGAIYMMDIQNFIGQSSTEADRKRDYRNRIDAEKRALSDSSMGQVSRQTEGQMSAEVEDKCPDKSPPDIRDRDKSIEIKDNINTSARNPDKQVPEPEADVAAIILNDGSEWRPTEALFAEYVRLYPGVDVKQQFNEMRGWCLSNPTQVKTRRGVKRFVNGWLSRKQNEGSRHGRQRQQNSGKENGFSGFPQRNYDMDSLESKLLGAGGKPRGNVSGKK